MWVLLFIASQYSVPPVEAKLTPTVVAQEFTSHAHCEAARRFMLGTFGHDPARMNDALARRVATGDLSSPQKVVVAARCLRK